MEVEMEEHMLSTGNFTDEELLTMWLKNPPRRPKRELRAGDCWEEEDGSTHCVDNYGVEREMK